MLEGRGGKAVGGEGRWGGYSDYGVDGVVGRKVGVVASAARLTESEKSEELGLHCGWWLRWCGWGSECA
jgi:hypothetical protein